MNFSIRSLSVLLLLASCGEDTKYGPAPVSSYTTTSMDASTSTSTSTGDTGPEGECAADGLERYFRWEDDVGGAAPTPQGVTVSYRFDDGHADEVEVACGSVEEIPTCWAPCGDPTAHSVVVDWDCGSRVHTVTDAPLPAVLTFSACMLEDTSGTDSSSTGSTSDGSEGGTSDGSGSTSDGSDSTSDGTSSDSGTDGGTSSGA